MAAPEIIETSQYLTVETSVEYSQTIQRSQFICSLRRIHNRAEFDAQMAGVQTLYPKASHHCWAYRLHAKIILEHASDAGEPAGTAGRPILGALKKHNLSNIMAVVTRYYGGVKLGVKGLIAAYGDTTLSAIDSAHIVSLEPHSRLCFTSTYDLYNSLLHKFEKFNIPASEIQAHFSETINGEVLVKNSILNTLASDLQTLSPAGTHLKIQIAPIDA